MSGKVYLVGAGPGAPELLTLKAARILSRANVVLHDALVSREVLALICPHAERIEVGKRCESKLFTQDEINSLLVSCVASHEVVVRLKGGDPLIFGRAAEEIEFLRKAGVDFEIVPGITSGIGAAAAAGVSLTDRRVASQVLFTTIRRGMKDRPIQWDSLSSATTLVVYMPGSDYTCVAQQLQEAGFPGDIPCAVVSNATGHNQKILRTSLANLSAKPTLPAPALIIVGRVVGASAIEIGSEFLVGRLQASARSIRRVSDI